MNIELGCLHELKTNNITLSGCWVEHQPTTHTQPHDLQNNKKKWLPYSELCHYARWMLGVLKCTLNCGVFLIGIDVHCKWERICIRANLCAHIYKCALSFAFTLPFFLVLNSRDRILEIIYLSSQSLITTPHPKERYSTRTRTWIPSFHPLQNLELCLIHSNSSAGCCVRRILAIL